MHFDVSIQECTSVSCEARNAYFKPQVKKGPVISDQPVLLWNIGIRLNIYQSSFVFWYLYYWEEVVH